MSSPVVHFEPDFVGQSQVSLDNMDHSQASVDTADHSESDSDVDEVIIIGSASPVSRRPTGMGKKEVSVVTLSNNNPNETRIPMMRRCFHFHYETVNHIPFTITVKQLRSVPHANKLPLTKPGNKNPDGDTLKSQVAVRFFSLQIVSLRAPDSPWTVHRTVKQMRAFDRRFHRCIYRRQVTGLPNLSSLRWEGNADEERVRQTLGDYFEGFTKLPCDRIHCSSILNFLELDNHGHHLLPPVKLDLEDYFNTPAVAAGQVIREYKAQTSDELNLHAGQLVSILEMPDQSESSWWMGKSELRLGFFPSDCVQVITREHRNSDSSRVSVSSPTPSTSQPPSTPAVLEKRSGKFVTHLRSRLQWRSDNKARLALRQSGILRGRLFGSDLGEYINNTGQLYPRVITECCSFIESNLIEGVYRINGDAMMIDRLRTIFDEERSPNWSDLHSKHLIDVFSVCSLLKAFFRELPNPIFTYQLYQDFFNLADLPNELKLQRIPLLFNQLPPPNHRVLCYLLNHLHKITMQTNIRQDSRNLGIIWSPNLLRSPLPVNPTTALMDCMKDAAIVEFLIREAPRILQPSPSSCQNARKFKMAPASYPSLLNSTLSRAVAGSLSVHLHDNMPTISVPSPESSPNPSLSLPTTPRLLDVSEAQRRFGSTATLDLHSSNETLVMTSSAHEDALSHERREGGSVFFGKAISSASLIEPNTQPSAMTRLRSFIKRSNSKSYNLTDSRPKSVVVPSSPVTGTAGNFLTMNQLLNKFPPVDPDQEIAQEQPESPPSSSPVAFQRLPAYTPSGLPLHPIIHHRPRKPPSRDLCPAPLIFTALPAHTTASRRRHRLSSDPSFDETTGTRPGDSPSVT